MLCLHICTDHLQLTLSRAKVEIEQATAEILNQQKFIATEVGIFAATCSFLLLIRCCLCWHGWPTNPSV